MEGAGRSALDVLVNTHASLDLGPPIQRTPGELAPHMEVGFPGRRQPAFRRASVTLKSLLYFFHEAFASRN